MKIKFFVNGMSCAACSARVEKVTRQIPGVKNADVNLLSGSMMVEAESDAVIPLIVQAVSNAGYTAGTKSSQISAKSAPQDKRSDPIKQRIIISVCFLAVLMCFTMGHMVGLPLPAWYTGTQNALVAALLQFMLTLPVVILNRSYYITVSYTHLTLPTMAVV